MGKHDRFLRGKVIDETYVTKQNNTKPFSFQLFVSDEEVEFPEHFLKASFSHCSDVTMSVMLFQITGVSIVSSTVGSGADQRKHQSSESLAVVRGIHRWPVDSPHKRSVMRVPYFLAIMLVWVKEKCIYNYCFVLYHIYSILLWALECILSQSKCTNVISSDLSTSGNFLNTIFTLPWLMLEENTEHDDVIIWKHFPRYWPFVREIHRSPVNSPHKRQWRGPSMFSLICLIKRLSKHSRGWWFETLSCPLWHRCNATVSYQFVAVNVYIVCICLIWNWHRMNWLRPDHSKVRFLEERCDSCW